MRIYVDMDGVLCDYESHWDYVNIGWDIEFPQSRPGFFTALKPIDGAIEGMNALVSAGHEVYILSAPSIKNNHCWSEKAAWIEKHLGFEWLPRLILTRQKQLLSDDNSVLIDDIEFSRAGQQVFNAKGLLVHFGYDGWDWPAIVENFCE